ncbi:MAG TPA: hypothetical protein VIU38_01600 [Anaerolineales bacterium]
MEISIAAMLGIAIATMFFGYFFGLFEGRGQGYKRRRTEEEQEHRVAPVATAPMPGPTQNLLELARDESGAARVTMDGRPVSSAAIAPEQRKRLIELMVMLRPWVDPSAAPARAVPEQAAPSVMKAAAAQPPTSVTGVPIGPTGAAVVPVAPANLSLVAQIDGILQTQIAGTPLAGRGIRLAEALHGGAIVFIGTAQYDGVDQVPDPEVRAAIRAATAEWEKGYVPR